MKVKPCCQKGGHPEVEVLQVKNLTLVTRRKKIKSQFSGLGHLQASLLIFGNCGLSSAARDLKSWTYNFPKASLIENTFWKQFSVGHQAEALAVKHRVV